MDAGKKFPVKIDFTFVLTSIECMREETEHARRICGPRPKIQGKSHARQGISRYPQILFSMAEVHGPIPIFPEPRRNSTLQSLNRLMDFKEFVRKEEMDESIRGIAQSLWGITKGIANTFDGAMTIGDEFIAKAVGQGTKGRMTGGVKRLGRGLKQIVWADPNAKDPEPERRPAKPATQQPVAKQKPSPTPNRQEQQPQNSQQPKASPTTQGEPTPNEKWQKLAAAYDRASNNGSSEASKKYIQFLMSQADPEYYIYFLKKLAEQEAAKKRKS
jgi:hypothetical protein